MELALFSVLLNVTVGRGVVMLYHLTTGREEENYRLVNLDR